MRNESEQAYETQINEWRQEMDQKMRRPDGWLTLAGLCWLHEGKNTIGSDPGCDIVLPAHEISGQIGVIDFHAGEASLTVNKDISLTVDGVTTHTAPLRNDHAEQGPSVM